MYLTIKLMHLAKLSMVVTRAVAGFVVVVVVVVVIIIVDFNLIVGVVFGRVAFIIIAIIVLFLISFTQ